MRGEWTWTLEICRGVPGAETLGSSAAARTAAGAEGGAGGADLGWKSHGGVSKRTILG